MAYQMPVDHLGAMSQQASMQGYMEPETVTRDSDEETTESTSTPGDKQRSIADSGTAGLKRAVSSPNVRGLGVDGIAMSAADKKRNKLGYHRTAVACGHCRRRKIRCIPAFEDASGRCQNCIRLKKDCHFFPVDQQSVPVGRRARAGSKADAAMMEGDVSASSSELGGPSILKSTPEEHMKSINGMMQSPLEPQETAGFPAYGEYMNNRPLPSTRTDLDQHLGYAEHQQNYDPRHQQFNVTMQPSPLHTRPDVLNSRNPYYSHTTNAMISSPLHSSPQSTTYASRDQSSGPENAWPISGLNRSVSSTQADEIYHPYASYRSQSYPANMRRSSEPQHIGFGYRGHPEALGAQYSQGTLTGGYQPGSSYGPGSFSEEMSGNASHLPVSTGVAYPSSWYANPGLPYVREEDDSGMMGIDYGRNQP